jgi:hypothetical protein
MEKKLRQLLVLISIILLVVTVISLIVKYWSDLRKLFPWLPNFKNKFDCDLDDSGEFDDFADV